MVPAPLEIQSPRYLVRPLDSDDFWHLRRLENEIWGGDATGQLCPYYLRLCTEIYPEWCFIALDGERPGYVLNFPNSKYLPRHAGGAPRYQKSKVNYLCPRHAGKLVQEDMVMPLPGEPDNRCPQRHNAWALGQRADDYYQRGDWRLGPPSPADLDRVRATPVFGSCLEDDSEPATAWGTRSISDPAL